MISGKVNRFTQAYKRKEIDRSVRMDYRLGLYDMSEPHSDIGVNLWGPGQALCFKADMSTVSFTLKLRYYTSRMRESFEGKTSFVPVD